MVRVTVIIPTFNRSEFLKHALETVQIQTYESLECIVVDDGSTDGTCEYLDSVDYDALRPIYHDENCGQSVARNTGIEKASGEYVMFLDSDDIIYPHAAETLVEALDEQPEDCVGAFTSTKLVNQRGRVRERRMPEGLVTEPTVENARDIGGLSCTMFRRTSLEEVGGFDEDLSRRVDADLYLTLLKRHKLFSIDEICCERRIHKDSISNDRDEVEESRHKIVKKHHLGDAQLDRRNINF